MNPKTITQAAAPFGLSVMGIVAQPGVVLLGAEPSLWPLFKVSAEFADGRADPLDRWSKRIINALAMKFGATTQFPSDGPPYPPFIRWALESGQFFQSPVGMMVHPRAGLMISLRGALIFDFPIAAPAPAPNPCERCEGKPCQSACPVAAFSGTEPYDVPACKSFLASPAGDDCMSHGCIARRACPVSKNFGRASAQSAYHMRHFKGA